VGEASAAESSLKRAHAVDPRNVLANRALATYLVSAGRAAEAEQHFKWAAEESRSLASEVELADYYIAQARPDDARRILEPMVTRSGVAAIAETRLAGLAYTSGQTLDAHKRLDGLLERQPNNAHALLLKARWLLSEGRAEEALSRATAAVSVAPRFVVAHYVRGLAESASHRSGDALRSFGEVLRLNPRAVIAQVHLSRLHLARNMVDSAVLYAEEALNTAPDSVDARLALVRAWAARGDVSRALAQLAALKRLASRVPAVYALEGSVRMVLGDREGAGESFARALTLDGASVEALTGMTTLDVSRRRYAAARARLEQVVAAGFESPEILLLLGKVYVAEGEMAKAEHALRRAIAVDPINIEPFSLLGRLYVAQNRLLTAGEEFDALATREPWNLGARVMAAMIAHARNNVDDAKRRYAEILKVNPRVALAANNLAAIYAESGENLDQAQQLAESAADQFPGHPEVQDTLGWVYFKRHALGQAIRRFEESIAADPRNPVYHYHLGLAHSKNGETDRAKRSLQTALKLNPAWTDAQQALASLQN
jgi:tetratricopeptide (TPR) repeat protein